MRKAKKVRPRKKNFRHLLTKEQKKRIAASDRAIRTGERKNEHVLRYADEKRQPGD